MTLHCGGANRSDKRRVIFLLFLQEQRMQQEGLAAGLCQLAVRLESEAIEPDGDAEHNKNKDDN